MQDLPHQWGEYARLQANSGRRSQIDSASWGLEAQMNAFLASPGDCTSADGERLERIRKSAARRERARSTLRQLHSSELIPEVGDPTLHLQARESLRLIAARISITDLALVVAVAHGYEHTHIATLRKVSAGSLRVRLTRLRRQLIALQLAA